jgi:hypothetical protein
MPDTTSGNRGWKKLKIPRIGPEEAACVFAQCEHLLDSATDFAEDLRQGGFARLLTPLNEQILELAVQPDSWGERTRARLISEVFARVRGIPIEKVSVEEMVQISNVVVPCFLLELGRRRQHIDIEFPNDPCEAGARFGLRAGPSGPIHSINGEQLARLVDERSKDQRIVAKVLVTCELTIFGLGSYSATGEEWADDDNAATAAEAQSFKRACSCFGLGRYLYYFSGTWVDLDDRKRPGSIPKLPDWATPEGWRRGLRPYAESTSTPSERTAVGNNGNGDGHNIATARASSTRSNR